jgi:hypothetical protein
VAIRWSHERANGELVAAMTLPNCRACEGRGAAESGARPALTGLPERNTRPPRNPHGNAASR